MSNKKSIDLLKTIMNTSGLSQEQIAKRLGVSFATVNAWLNGRAVPQKSKIERIKKLYLAQDSSCDGGPIYITLDGIFKNMKVGDELQLKKEPEEDDFEMILAAKSFGDKLHIINIEESIEVANSKESVARGTYSAGRIYDKIGDGAKCKIMFIMDDVAIAVITDFGEVL